MGFVIDAQVFHLVPAARMNPRYLLRKAFAFGVGTAQAGAEATTISTVAPQRRTDGDGGSAGRPRARAVSRTGMRELPWLLVGPPAQAQWAASVRLNAPGGRCLFRLRLFES